MRNIIFAVVALFAATPTDAQDITLDQALSICGGVSV